MSTSIDIDTRAIGHFNALLKCPKLTQTDRDALNALANWSVGFIIEMNALTRDLGYGVAERVLGVSSISFDPIIKAVRAGVWGETTSYEQMKVDLARIIQHGAIHSPLMTTPPVEQFKYAMDRICIWLDVIVIGTKNRFSASTFVPNGNQQALLNKLRGFPNNNNNNNVGDTKVN